MPIDRRLPDAFQTNVVLLSVLFCYGHYTLKYSITISELKMRVDSIKWCN